MERGVAVSEPRLPDPTVQLELFKPPETPKEPMQYLLRSCIVSAQKMSKALGASRTVYSNPNPNSKAGMFGGFGGSSNNAGDDPILEDAAAEGATALSGNPFSFPSSEISQLIMERIMSQSQKVSPRTSGWFSHISGPLHWSLTDSDSPPVSPSEINDVKYGRMNNYSNTQYRNTNPSGVTPAAGGRAEGRWLKEQKEKKEETRAQNAQLHAAVSVAGVAAAVAVIAAATAASSGTSGKDQETAKTYMAVASDATLVAAQCVEAAEALGAERDHLALVVSSAVNVRSSGDIMTLNAAAATALRVAATLKARALKDVWNIAAVIPAEKGITVSNGINGSSGSHSGKMLADDNFHGICSIELLASGCKLLKRTRNYDLHWKIVSVYIDRSNQVILKMKSRYVAGTITKKKKYGVIDVIKNMRAWPRRHLLVGGDIRRYFGLKTIGRGIVEFECRNQREYEVWTEGVSRLLSLAEERSDRHKI